MGLASHMPSSLSLGREPRLHSVLSWSSQMSICKACVGFTCVCLKEIGRADTIGCLVQYDIMYNIEPRRVSLFDAFAQPRLAFTGLYLVDIERRLL